MSRVDRFMKRNALKASVKRRKALRCPSCLGRVGIKYDAEQGKARVWCLGECGQKFEVTLPSKIPADHKGQLPGKDVLR